MCVNQLGANGGIQKDSQNPAIWLLLRLRPIASNLLVPLARNTHH